MNLNDYIASGILEEYILGQLSAEKRREVEAMAAMHPEVREELRTIEEALAQYGLAQARSLPPALKAEILDRIALLEKQQKPDGKKGIDYRNRFRWWAFALLGLSLLTAWSIFRSVQQRREMKEWQQLQESTHASCDSIRVRNEQLERQLKILENPGLEMVYLHGTDKAKSAQVMVAYIPADHKTYLRVDALPAPQAGRQYQLWAIVAGAPVSMGVFDIPTDTSRLIEVPHVANAQAFAVTLETAGGVPSPTLSEMYVIGNVGG